MDLSHVKLLNGDDLIGIVEEVDTEVFKLSSALQMVNMANLGMQAVRWTIFSKNEETVLKYKDVFFVNPASALAAETYLEVLQQRIEESMEELYDYESSATIH